MHSKHTPFDKPGKPLIGILLCVSALVVGGGGLYMADWLGLIGAGIITVLCIAEFIPQTALRSSIRAVALMCFSVWTIGVVCIWGYQIIHYLIMRWF